jgi:hypothetical protein
MLNTGRLTITDPFQQQLLIGRRKNGYAGNEYAELPVEYGVFIR